MNNETNSSLTSIQKLLEIKIIHLQFLLGTIFINMNNKYLMNIILHYIIPEGNYFKKNLSGHFRIKNTQW